MDQRRVRLYFDKNDEFVLEDAIPELLETEFKALNEYDLNIHDEILMEKISRKYHSVVVFFGNEELEIQGTTKITKTIFAGTQDRQENALLFLENLNKIK